MQPAANTAVPDVKRTKARFVVSESSYSYMPTNTKRKGQLNTEIAKGHRQGKREREREHTDDELSKTEKGKSNLHLLKIKNIATRCRTSVCML